MSEAPQPEKSTPRVARSALETAEFVFQSRPPADMNEVRRALRHTLRALETEDIAADTLNVVSIALAEVLNNVVEHALRGRQGGRFELRYLLSEAKLRFYVQDNGRPMPGNTLPSGLPPLIGNTRADLPEGGWGWSLVTKLAENIRYQRAEDKNLIKFSISTHTKL
ncbi:ATP-binding protein [Cognatishimia sp. SS12]|uniref:ATP-binding protein n=1 Tax=Cognatishimia sp. SS12 TaxID=2979465 RepID=UPI00232D0281|nr:ATP-binding protein [Cognatishimia sp. SS12]MDC0737937.1 ATP-binding protein [Cognatishimia sp. SS12]